MPNYPINNQLYTYFWNKYRPAILQLMKEAVNGPQEYKFQQHEFKDINPKEKGGYAFTMDIHGGKSQNSGLKDTIKKWVVAQDLLSVLQKSAKAMELMEDTTYRFTMDKQFVLHVSVEAPAESEEVVDDETHEESADQKESVVEEKSEKEVEEVVSEEQSSEVAEEAPKEEKEKKKKEKVS